MGLDVNQVVRQQLRALARELEHHLDRDVLGLFGPIVAGVEHKTRNAIDRIRSRRNRLAVVLYTGGGMVEIAERIVTVIRQHYADVAFIVPDVAMSAGTVLAMSGDAIMMDYASCLGPIDPQVQREGRLVPARSYLLQYQALIDKAKNGTLTTPEFAILQDYDQAELHSFQMACDLSVSLLVNWLSTYKFKDWTRTETAKKRVTLAMRRERAREVATMLMEHERWGTHDRGISMRVLREDVKLRVEDLAGDGELHDLVRAYFTLALDFMQRNEIPQLTQTCEYL